MPIRNAPPLPWYRVPLLWLGLGIWIAFIAASVHLIMVSQHQSPTATPAHPAHESVKFRGVPLTDSNPALKTDTEDKTQ